MTKYAQIPTIGNGVVFSDPTYDQKVWCQYRRKFQDENWVMKMDAHTDNGMHFFRLTIGRPTLAVNVICKEDCGEVNVSYPQRYAEKTVELGRDSSHFFCGTMDTWSACREEAALRTEGTGFFGNLMVFTCKGEKNPAGFLLLGAIGENMISPENLFKTFVSSFEGQEISEKAFAKKTDINSIEFLVQAAKESRAANNYKNDMQSTEKEGHLRPSREKW